MVHNRVKLILCICALLSCIIIFPSVVFASDVLVWQGQYYAGTTFNTGTYDFTFTVYDAATGGNSCYTNTTTLITGSFGEWKTEQTGVNSACNNVSKDYFLNININGVDQTPRRRLVVWNSLRKNVNEATTGVLQTDTQVVAPIVQANTQVVAPLVNATQVVANEITVSSNANILGTLRGHSPLKIGDSIQFISTTDSNLFSIYTAGPNITGSNVSSSYDGVIIHQIESHTNPAGIEECWWDREDQEMRMCMDKTKIELWNDVLIDKNIDVVGNVTASHFIGDGSLLTNLPAGGAESDPKWTANSSTVARTGECPAGQVVQNTTTSGVQCMTPAAAGAESDPQWSANFTNMQTDCNSGDYVYGVDDDGTLKCREDQTGSSGGGLTLVYSGSDLTATNAAHTTIFTIALTPSKMNIVKAYLAQSSSTNGVAIQNRVIVSESGPIGNCNFVTQTGAAAEKIDNIAVSTDSADTGVTAMSLDINIPFINTVTCTVLADTNPRDLIIQFDSERNDTVTTYAGSYYVNAVN